VFFFFFLQKNHVFFAYNSYLHVTNPLFIQ